MKTRSVISHIFCALLLLQCKTKDPLSGARPVLESITISSSEKIFFVGEKYQFKATGHFSNKQTQDITFSATWESSDTLVRIDSTSGIAEFKGKGNAEITASSIGEDGKVLKTQSNFSIHKPVKIHDGAPSDFIITSDDKCVLVVDRSSKMVHTIQLPDNILSDREFIEKDSLSLESIPDKIVLSKNFAYVVGRDPNKITALELSNLPQLSEKCSWTFESRIISIYSNTTNDFAFAILSDGDSVFVLNASNCSSNTFQVGSDPFYEYVGGNPATSKLVVIDKKSFPLTAWIYSFENMAGDSIPTDEFYSNTNSIWPHPENNKVYIITDGPKMLYPLSLDVPPNELRPVDLSGNPSSGIAFTKQNHQGYITLDVLNVIAFDTDTDDPNDPIEKQVERPDLVFPNLGQPIDIVLSPNDEFLYILAEDLVVINAQIRIYKYKIRDNKLIRAVPITGTPTAAMDLRQIIKITNDGKWLLTIDSGSGGALYALPAF